MDKKTIALLIMGVVIMVLYSALDRATTYKQGLLEAEQRRIQKEKEDEEIMNMVDSLMQLPENDIQNFIQKLDSITDNGKNL